MAWTIFGSALDQAINFAFLQIICIDFATYLPTLLLNVYNSSFPRGKAAGAYD